MSELPKRMTTRAKNAAIHPGAVDAKRPRRGKQEIQQERELAVSKKHENKNKKEEGINRIAALEDELARADAEAKNLPA